MTRFPYPNPAHSSVTVSLKGVISGRISVSVTDVYGKTITTEQLVLQPTTDYIITMPLPSLKSGLYFVKVLVNKEVQSHMLMVQ
jgi:hypothetical protein